MPQSLFFNHQPPFVRKTLLFSVATRWGQQRLVRVLSVLLGLCATPAVRAQESSRWAGVENAGELSCRVWACNPGCQRGQVQLVNAKHRILYEQLSSAVSFGQSLNLRELPDGRYAFVVTIGRAVHRFGLELSSSQQRVAALGDDQLPVSPRPANAAPVAKQGH